MMAPVYACDRCGATQASWGWHHSCGRPFLLQQSRNLNEAWILTDMDPVRAGQDSIAGGISAHDPHAACTVYFRDLEQALISHIEAAPIVLGCIAWLTSAALLRALARRQGVAIVVQKEDFLRPDLGQQDNWRQYLRHAYTQLPAGPDRYAYPGLVSHLSICGDPSIEAVRCAGHHNSQHASAWPRMHHKFIVLCDSEPATQTPEGWWSPGKVKPYGVWTGSFNFTKNATESLENGLYIESPALVQAYYEEWGRCTALSEPLDWDSDWVAPEWRIGT